MSSIKKIYTETSLATFLITVLLAILIAGFAMFVFRIFPFNTWFNEDVDSFGIQMNSDLSL